MTKRISLTYIDVLWLLIWAGMFSGLYNIQSPKFLASPFGFIQGARALLPVLAAYLGLMWILATRSRFPYFGTPVGFLFLYWLIGLVMSFTLSPDKLTAVYWAVAYLAPLLVVWMALHREESLAALRRIIFVNDAVILAIVATLLPGALNRSSGQAVRMMYYDLPFGLGKITANGVGRFALVALIYFLVFLATRSGKIRWLSLAPLGLVLLLLAQTQSRTALLGLTVTLLLFVLLKGLSWRFLLLGPVAAYIIWLSGFEWRAHGDVGRLVSLTGRQTTWQKGIERIQESPFLGWGFHADRILLNSEHMHNSYLHTAINSGLFGALSFTVALLSVWFLILRSNLLRRARDVIGPDRGALLKSVFLLGFLTSRSFFESTAAFYGVDLLLLLPAMTYIWLWTERGVVAAEAVVSAKEPLPAGSAAE
jgi:hypothetical protein